MEFTGLGTGPDSTSEGEARVGATEDFRHTKVGDLKLAIFGDEKVLKLDIAVGNPVGMQVVNTLNQLLEQTHTILLSVIALEMALLHKTEKITFRAVFHNVIPTPMVSAKAEGLDDIGVVQALRNAEF
ncbi:hypothetical protein HG530_001895 [Fusarium avenaceum]|nr:hypothetical protein HG530_001895 [Fusarium avenaceum]